MIARARLFAILATLALLLGAVDSHAQFGSKGIFGGSRGGNKDQSKSQDNSRPGQQGSESYEQTEYRLSLLEEDLHLQSAQRASWESFAGKVRAYASDLARERARAMTASSSGGNSISGVQHIEEAADTARNHATALDDVAAAAKALYAGLTPDQKMLADVRIVTILAPPPRPGPPGSGSNLPDLGSSGRTSR
jgi:hypothetical protein